MAESYEDKVRRVLRALVKARKATLTGVAVVAGHSEVWLTRKIGTDNAARRPLLASDVDEVLTVLQVTPEEFVRELAGV